MAIIRKPPVKNYRFRPEVLHWFEFYLKAPKPVFQMVAVPVTKEQEFAMDAIRAMVDEDQEVKPDAK